MRFGATLVLFILLVGCDPVPKQTVAEHAAMEIETNQALTASHLRSMVSAQTQAKALNVVDKDLRVGQRALRVAAESASSGCR